MRKKILITTFGFMGDLNPYIALARRFKEEAHFPVIATSEYYRAAVKKAGIYFYPIRPELDAGDYKLMSRVIQPSTPEKNTDKRDPAFPPERVLPGSHQGCSRLSSFDNPPAYLCRPPGSRKDPSPLDIHRSVSNIILFGL